MTNPDLKLEQARAYVEEQLRDGTSQHAAMSYAVALYDLSDVDEVCLLILVGAFE